MAETGKATGAKQYQKQGIHHAPWFGYSLASVGVYLGIGANLWQVFTSVIAFFSMFTAGAVYRHMDSHGQGTAAAAALAISIGLALSFQLGVLFFVFRVHDDFKEQQVKVGDTMQAAKATALYEIAHHRLLMSWCTLSFLADTVGDFTFINLITADWMLLLIYTLALYSVSTIMLSAALEKQWAAKIALENWRAFRAYARLMQLKVQAAGVQPKPAAQPQGARP